MDDQYVKLLKNRVDSMSVDQIVFLFVPEMLELEYVAERHGDTKACERYAEVLKYVKTKVELEDFKVIDNFKLVVPSPADIINKRSPKGIPNN